MQNLKKLRIKHGLSQKAFADIMHASQNTVSQWENGKREPSYAITQRIADYFGVTTDYLLGRENKTIAPRKKGIKIPVLGRVQAGIPVDAIEEIIDYEEITEEMASQGEYFGLVIRGQSMMPRIVEGDVIIVRKQSDIDSGDIAVILVDGNDATVKKIRKTENGIELVPLNPSFDIIYYSNEEIERLPVQIIGKVVELRGKF
jgi:repressor LexA